MISNSTSIQIKEEIPLVDIVDFTISLGKFQTFSHQITVQVH